MGERQQAQSGVESTGEVEPERIFARKGDWENGGVRLLREAGEVGGPFALFHPEPRPAPALDLTSREDDDAATGFEVIEGTSHAVEVEPARRGGFVDDFEGEEPFFLYGVGEHGVAENKGVGACLEGEVGEDEGIEGSVGMIGDDQGGASLGDLRKEIIDAVDGDFQVLMGRLVGVAMTFGDTRNHVAEAGEAEDLVEFGCDFATKGRLGEKGKLLCEGKEGIGTFLFRAVGHERSVKGE